MPTSPELRRLLAAPPATHVDEHGTAQRWGVAPRVLEILDDRVTAGARTLETGAGLSTALFALKGARHDCVVPWNQEADRLREWGRRERVSFDGVTFHVGFSDRVLPGLGEKPLDLVLVDGGHGFPIPFLDWWYAGRRLRAGGILVVDDTQLWTGRVLSGFLAAQEGWELVEKLPMRATVFRRTTDEDSFRDWVDQPYVLRRSFHQGPRGLVRRALRASSAVRARRSRQRA